MKKLIGAGLAATVAALAVAGGAATAPTQATSLTVYSGRDEKLVKPIMDLFMKETGIELNVRYASSTSLATALIEEGARSPADVFWATEAIGTEELLAWLSVYQLSREMMPRGIVEVLWHD